MRPLLILFLASIPHVILVSNLQMLIASVICILNTEYSSPVCSQVRWDSLSSVTCKLIDNKLLDPTRVAESLTRLMESEYGMTETMIASLWTIIQYISQG